MRTGLHPMAILAVATLVLAAGCSSPSAGPGADGEGVDAGEGPGPGASPSTEPAAPRPSSSGTPTPRPTPRPAANASGADAPGPAGNATPGAASAPAAGKPVRVAVLDTGILASHEAFAPGQVVAWYDFGREGRPGRPTDLWDPATEPHDDAGHGTAAASMVAGRSGRQTPSHAPGVELVVAKVTGPDDSAAWADVADALRWAREVAGADVLSLSFYAYLPQAGGGHVLLAALEEARAAGMLPVVLAGNGMDNLGVPTASWLHPPATSRASLVVGGANGDGSPVAPAGSLDPEVTALYSVTAACPGGDGCHDAVRGTSFSTPLVAGMAASILAAARAAGQAMDADRLEVLLKRCAADTPAPPAFEGYGFAGDAALECAVGHAVAGTDPPAADPVTEAWVETVQDTERQAWSAV